MNYTVTWRREAENQLMALWLRALDKNAIAGHVEHIDRSLGRDPHVWGESRDANSRLAFFRPLSVRYQIDDASKTVVVVAIQWVGR